MVAGARTLPPVINFRIIIHFRARALYLCANFWRQTKPVKITRAIKAERRHHAESLRPLDMGADFFEQLPDESRPISEKPMRFTLPCLLNSVCRLAVLDNP